LLNIEIKWEAVTDQVEGGLVDKVLILVQERQMLDQVIVSSFLPKALKQARQLSAELKTASLCHREPHVKVDPLEVIMAVSSNGFNTNASHLPSEIVRRCHHHGFPVAAYTVNKKRKMRKLIGKGVDAIFTDYPNRLLEILAEDSALSLGEAS
jgi:glycerophosphoryl diester phosphodiesterase